MKVHKYYNGVYAATVQLTSAIRTQQYAREITKEQIELLRNIKDGETLQFGELSYTGVLV